MPGDLQHAAHCEAVVGRAVSELGGVDILVDNAAHQGSFKKLEDISNEEWELTFRVNIHAMFYLAKAAVPHMQPGSAIINTASINSDQPNPTLLAYATTKGAISNFTAGLAQLLAKKSIRGQRRRAGTHLDPAHPSTLPEEAVAKFGENTPLKRPGQPAELASAFVMLADPLSSYITGAVIPVTGGRPSISQCFEEDTMATGERAGRRRRQVEAGQPATPEEDRQQQSRTQPARSEKPRRQGKQLAP